MKKHLLMISLASLCFVTAAAQASTMSSEDHKAATEKIKADYYGDIAKCASMADMQAKAVCDKEAKGKEEVAQAKLKEQNKPSERHARAVSKKEVEAEYKVAKQKCQDEPGDAMGVCIKNARAARHASLVDIKKHK